jgi:hypothetical protein
MPHWLHRAESFLANLAAGNWWKKFTAFYRTPRFITAFTRAHHCSLSWAGWIPSTPTRFHLRSILILFCHVNLGPLVVSASRFATRTLYARLSHTCYVCCPSPWFNNCNNIWGRLQIMKLPIKGFSPPSYYFLPLRPIYSHQCRVLKHSQSVFHTHTKQGTL